MKKGKTLEMYNRMLMDLWAMSLQETFFCDKRQGKLCYIT